MKQIGRRSFAVIIIAGMFLTLCAVYAGSLLVNAGDWASYPADWHLYTDGSIVKAGTITDRSGTVLAQTVDSVRSFAEDGAVRRATLHAVGDLDGNISTGIHSAYLSSLTGYDIVNGTYSFRDEGNDIELTIDAQLCVTALDALGGRAGAVGVYNYQTGEVVCMVSSPTYDPAYPLDENDMSSGVFLNRFLSGRYTPGSVFKLVATAAALENIEGISERTFHCDGGCYIDGEWISCMGNHGDVTLEQALVSSCNAAYAQLAVELGGGVMTKTAESMGITSSFKMGKIPSVAGNYDVSEASGAELGWSGIGQYTDMINPFQYMMLMGAVANGGEAVDPYIVNKITTSMGVGLYPSLINGKTRLLSAETAAALKEMMRAAVRDNYGDDTFPGLTLCGKTGTAEVDGEDPHSWFVGFSEDPKKPYAFAVVVENGGYGIDAAAQTARAVLSRAPEVESGALLG